MFSALKRLMAPEVIPEAEATDGGDVERAQPGEDALAGGVDRRQEGDVGVGLEADIADDDIGI